MPVLAMTCAGIKMASWSSGSPVEGDDEAEIVLLPVEEAGQVKGRQRIGDPGDDIADGLGGHDPEPVALDMHLRQIDPKNDDPERRPQQRDPEGAPEARDAAVEIAHAVGVEMGEAPGAVERRADLRQAQHGPAQHAAKKPSRTRS